MAIPKMSKVTMFKSSDEKLHATLAECELHQARLSVKPLVNELLADAGFEFEAQMSREDVATFVSLHADALLNILTPLIPKKTRMTRGHGISPVPVADDAEGLALPNKQESLIPEVPFVLDTVDQPDSSVDSNNIVESDDSDKYLVTN